MWIFLSDAFLSVVAHRDKPDCLLVRARRRGDLEKLIGAETQVDVTEDADYLFRATVSRNVFAKVIADRVKAIDYDNFKSAIKDEAYHDACLDVWATMRELQQREDD
ncbi:MAG TPA: hypothetical protein VGK19_18200 [Capsulimonadaceae bacterium]|jgi:hypothetical protein